MRERGEGMNKEREEGKQLTPQTDPECPKSDMLGAYVLPALDDPVWACPGETRPSSVIKCPQTAPGSKVICHSPMPRRADAISGA